MSMSLPSFSSASDSDNQPPVYVVSLADDGQRRANLQLSLGTGAGRFEWVSAVDLRGPVSSEALDHLAPSRQAGMTSAEVGCSLSHIHVMQKFLASGDEVCLVLEDDVIGTSSALDRALVVMNQVPPGAVVIFGGQQGLKNNRFLTGRMDEVLGVFEISPISRRFLSRACCYGMTRSAAQRLLEMQERYLLRADEWSVLLHGFEHVYFLNLFDHPIDLQKSHIEQSRAKARGGFLRRLVSDGISKTFQTNLVKLYVKWGLPLRGYRQIYTGPTSGKMSY